MLFVGDRAVGWSPARFSGEYHNNQYASPPARQLEQSSVICTSVGLDHLISCCVFPLRRQYVSSQFVISCGRGDRIASIFMRSMLDMVLHDCLAVSRLHNYNMRQAAPCFLILSSRSFSKASHASLLSTHRSCTSITPLKPVRPCRA